MASIKAIRTKNIQCHDEVVLDELPSKGIITIIGENSDGKSAVTKAFVSLMSGDIRNVATRRALVNWDKSWAEVEVERDDGAILRAHITVESADTFVEYYNPIDGETYRRHMRDGGYSDLVAEFGIHWDNKTDISLNLYETFDPLIFVKTSASVNAELLAYCLSDPRVEQSIENQKTFVESLDFDAQQLISEQMEIRAVLASMVTYDIPNETKYMQLFEIYERNIRALMKSDVTPPEMPDYTKFEALDLSVIKKLAAGLAGSPSIPVIERPPETNLAKVHRLANCLRTPPQMEDAAPAPKPDPRIHKLWTIITTMPEVDIRAYGEEWMQSLADLAALEARRCPTCGRRLLDGEQEHIVCS